MPFLPFFTSKHWELIFILSLYFCLSQNVRYLESLNISDWHFYPCNLHLRFLHFFFGGGGLIAHFFLELNKIPFSWCTSCKNAAARQRAQECWEAFLGNRSRAELPGSSRRKAGVCNLREGGRHLYTLVDAEVAGPFHIWLESGSRVLIGLFGLASVFFFFLMGPN